MADVGLLIARLFLGVPFVVWGVMILHDGQTQMGPMLKGMGLPDVRLLVYLVGLCQLIGGIAIVIGYPVVVVGVLLGLWCLLTGLVCHRNDPNELLGHAAMGGGYFLLAAAGPGSLSLFGGTPTGIWAYLP